MKNVLLTAIFSSLATLAAVQLFAAAEIRERTLLENQRVRVLERVMPAGTAREPHIRPTDQVIVFLNDTAYERVDPETGEKTVRHRKAGEVIWHDKGENAPKLTNVTQTDFRALVIELP